MNTYTIISNLYIFPAFPDQFSVKILIWLLLATKSPRISCTRQSHYEETFYFIIKFPEIPGSHWMDCRRMKGWVDFVATLSMEPMNWESSALTTRPLLQTLSTKERKKNERMSRDGATKQPPRNGFAALTNFIPLVPFYIPWKQHIKFYCPWNHQKTYGFLKISGEIEVVLMFSVGIKEEYWHE